MESHFQAVDIRANIFRIDQQLIFMFFYVCQGLIRLPSNNKRSSNKISVVLIFFTLIAKSILSDSPPHLNNFAHFFFEAGMSAVQLGFSL